MSSGVTDEMRKTARQLEYRRWTPRPTTPRDRSLRGKARIKARKAANKVAKA